LIWRLLLINFYLPINDLLNKHISALNLMILLNSRYSDSSIFIYFFRFLLNFTAAGLRGMKKIKILLTF